MKRLALAMAAVFAAANALQAANPADLLSMNAAGLEKAGFNVAVNGAGLAAPKPGIPQPVYQQPGNNHNQPGNNHNPNWNNHNQPGNDHNPNWNNHNQPGNNHNQPGWNPQQPWNNHPYPPVNPPYNPGHPSYPPVYPPVNPTYPPVYPPYPPVQMQNFRFQSGNFVFSSDAQRSMNEAVAALQAINAVILEKRLNGTSYVIVYQAPFKVEPQKYVSGNYVFASDAQRAAGETAAALASQGMIVLEKNVSGTQFTITYFSPRYNY